jgi:hypothetical protein
MDAQTNSTALDVSGQEVGKTRKRKIRKRLLIGLAAVFGLFLALDFGYKNSGSAEWKLEREKNGITMWKLKTPGSRIEKLKLTMKVPTTLAGMIKLIEDTSSCVDVGCNGIRQFDTKILPGGFFNAYYDFKVDLPFPLKTREFVILIQHHQDPATKEIEMNIMAAPNKIPPNPDYIRVAHLNNIWHLTPNEKGEVEIEYHQDSDIGGNIPYFIKNKIAPEALYQLFVKFETIMGLEKFKTAKLDYVKELGEDVQDAVDPQRKFMAGPVEEGP